MFCPDWDGAAAYDAGAPFRVFRQPERFLWPTSQVADRIEDAARAMGAEVLLFGATYPLALLGPRLAARGLPYLSAAHGFEYWLSIAPGTHALLRHATSRATRVPVLCSAFIARTVRTAVPRSVPVSVLYPGADVTRFRPDLATDDIREALGVGDASARRLREPAGRPQGPGHADPRDAGHPPARSRRRARDRGRRPRRGSPARDGRGAPHRRGRLLGPGRRGRSASLLRGRRCLRDAVPNEIGRARGGGVGQRLHRGRRLRQARGGRRFRGRAGVARRRGDGAPRGRHAGRDGRRCGREPVGGPRAGPGDGDRGEGARPARTHLAGDRRASRLLAGRGRGHASAP